MQKKMDYKEYNKYLHGGSQAATQRRKEAKEDYDQITETFKQIIFWIAIAMIVFYGTKLLYWIANVVLPFWWLKI